ncbi:Gadd34 [Drosophila busckii]|uniref:Gadd34 n=2 Tax=Drosophila busckii TaxID=30019 RepID=A0A0M3QVM0_DROBS|nr:Gadd34 [Drosophila busckii]
MIGNMSSPIHDQIRCSPSRCCQPETPAKASEHPVDKEGPGILLQLMAVLQKPPSAKMTSIQFKTSSEPTFCYFFIDLHPQSFTQYDSINSGLNKSTFNIGQENSHNNRSHSADTTFMGLERQRSISECSDDSFICFEEEDLDGNRGDEDSDASNDSTDDKKATFNPADVCLPLQKKVRFNLKPEVHKMHTWDFAYRAARKGMWQEVARDRERFKQRINRLEPILNIICSANHREKVYKERFLLVK